MFAQPTETHSTLIPTRSKAALSHADDQKTSVAPETTWYFCCSGDRSLPWVLEHILHLAPDLSYPLLPFVNSGQSPFAAGAQVSPNKHNTTRSLTYHLQPGSAAKPFPRSGSILPPQTQLKILTYGLGTTGLSPEVCSFSNSPPPQPFTPLPFLTQSVLPHTSSPTFSLSYLCPFPNLSSLQRLQ